MKATATNSFGPSFNSAGGGWYAMERTDSFIKVWFWTRNAGNVPSDVKNGGTTVDTDNWVCDQLLSCVSINSLTLSFVSAGQPIRVLP